LLSYRFLLDLEISGENEKGLYLANWPNPIDVIAKVSRFQLVAWSIKLSEANIYAKQVCMNRKKSYQLNRHFFTMSILLISNYIVLNLIGLLSYGHLVDDP